MADKYHDNDDDINQETSSKKKVKKSTFNVTHKNWPNILISGTPGTGKSTLAEKLAYKFPGNLQWINIGEFAKSKNCYGDYDEVYKCHELDEDKLLDELEDPIALGGVIIDHHMTDFYPERFFDIVFVLRTNNSLLYDRLKDRGYDGKKLEDNIECEIFQTILDEARESYKSEIVHELQSNTQQDLESNLERISSWIHHWRKDNVQS